MEALPGFHFNQGKFLTLKFCGDEVFEKGWQVKYNCDLVVSVK